jgi:hypothetical protein
LEGESSSPIKITSTNRYKSSRNLTPAGKINETRSNLQQPFLSIIFLQEIAEKEFLNSQITALADLNHLFQPFKLPRWVYAVEN